MGGGGTPSSTNKPFSRQNRGVPNTRAGAKPGRLPPCPQERRGQRESEKGLPENERRDFLTSFLFHLAVVFKVSFLKYQLHVQNTHPLFSGMVHSCRCRLHSSNIVRSNLAASDRLTRCVATVTTRRCMPRRRFLGWSIEIPDKPSLFQATWDLIVDFGLMVNNRRCLYPRCTYPILAALDVALRTTWLLTYLPDCHAFVRASSFNRECFAFMISSLETW